MRTNYKVMACFLGPMLVCAACRAGDYSGSSPSAPRPPRPLEDSMPAMKPLKPETQQKLQQLLDAAVSQNRGHGGGVLRIESLRDGLMWESASGQLEHKGEPMTPRDRFEVASITKLVTATCVMSLQEAGRVDLDAPLVHYLDRDLMRELLIIDGH